MNFSLHLLEFLKKQGTAFVPNFGTFYLKNTSATLDESGKNILPPGKEIAFNNETPGYASNFIEYLSAQEKITLLEAEIEIRKQVTFWNSKLEKEGSVKIENFGTFFLNDSKLHFSGEKTETISEDFYGLEEINLSAIKHSAASKNSDKSYKLSKTIYWVFPLIIGLSALAYFGITKPEQLFGNASFLKGFEKKPVPPVKKDSIKIDSVAVNIVSDSLKADSLKSAALIKKAPVKKWSSKKYSKSKWKKPKKRRNH